MVTAFASSCGRFINQNCSMTRYNHWNVYLRKEAVAQLLRQWPRDTHSCQDFHPNVFLLLLLLGSHWDSSFTCFIILNLLLLPRKHFFVPNTQRLIEEHSFDFTILFPTLFFTHLMHLHTFLLPHCKA